MSSAIVNPILLVILSTLVSCVAVAWLIRYLRGHHIGQPIREEGNREHLKKAGTPTMGGLAFLTVAIVFILCTAGFTHETVTLLIGVVGFGAIGFLDDYEKVKKKENEGLTPRQKLILQTALALAMVLVVYFSDPRVATQRIPFFNFQWNFGIFWIPILMFIVVGTVNAVNLTDGLDGLLTGVSLPVFGTIAMISVLPHVLNPTVATEALVFLGALMGFLFFNSNPASVMMGDTGSMGIGGAVTAMMLSLNLSIFLVILGGIYVAETLSVMIQVAYFKRTGGKRIFLMSPIHHHFELKGYAEQKVTVAFSLVSALLCLLTLAIV